jgi:catechol 2,3-dioxygenase-like lactoylglutathione lyase family enzyme
VELKLGPLRQIALPSANLPRSVEFYRDKLGLEFIAQYDPPGLAFFRLGRTRLLFEQSTVGRPGEAVLYFEVPDIDAAYTALKGKGLDFDSAPHLIYRDDQGTFGPAGEEEWMAFFKDPDGNVLALAARKAT